MNNHFSTAGANVQSQIEGVKGYPLNSVKSVSNNLLLGNISESEICKIVSNFESKFSYEVDVISNNFLKK